MNVQTIKVKQTGLPTLFYFFQSDSGVRMKLGGFSGRSSRKGSSCSTPTISGGGISSSMGGGRGEVDYPSPNFVRPSLVNVEDVPVQVNKNNRVFKNIGLW